MKLQLSRRMRVCITAALLAVGSVRAFAQKSSSQDTLPRNGAAQSYDVSTGSPSVESSNSVTVQRNWLTAAQIEDLMRQRPELVVELKSLLADQMQERGVSALADSITDEQLFHQIVVSEDFRASVTNWLQARGYVSRRSAKRSMADARAGDDVQSRSTDSTIDRPVPGVLETRITEERDMAPERRSSVDGEAGYELPRSRNGSRAPAQITIAQQTSNVTDVPDVLHQPTPYNLQALRDLYTQVPQDAMQLKRFGSDVFLQRESGEGASGVGGHPATLDVPIGPDYILGTGDSIVVNIWGGVSQSLTRTVDREGKISLPEAGSLVVAGLSLEHAQSVIENALKQQFRNARVDVTIARLRTVRIYVVGDVQRPGAYDISSLSTPLNALYAAGGPTSAGSLRVVRHYRGQKLLREVDLYDFLLHGLRVDDERLASGDTLLVPIAGPQVAVFGAVKRSAVYELKGEETLAALLDDAGGATVAAALNHITIERIRPNHGRETVSLDQSSGSAADATLKSIAAFKIKDGDRVYVAPILPYSERAIYIEGHVARPGKYPYRDEMQLSDVLRSYQDLLPEPAGKGDVVRLVPPDLHAETIQFDIAEVLIGNSHVMLQPFDTVHIYGRYEIDSPQVTVRGEVLRPGAYALSRGMTVAQLVRMAGGFKRDALLDSADLTSYSIQEGKKVLSQRSSVDIGTAVRSGNGEADILLKPGDILTIHQISGWNDIGASVKITGEATYPGSYGLQEGEHLSSVLRRAGGLRATAYADGAVLVRVQVKELEEKSREELIRQIETTSVSARLTPTLTAQDESAHLQAAVQQQNEVLQRLRSQPASGRLVIHISTDIASWENTPADIELRSGDVLTIPKRPGFVLVSGQVYNASAITYVPEKTAGWYLQNAGGTNEVANTKEIFIVRANGTVIGHRSNGVFSRKVLSTKLGPGDLIVVPQKVVGGSLLWRNLLTVAQITSSIAITAAVAGVI